MSNKQIVVWYLISILLVLVVAACADTTIKDPQTDKEVDVYFVEFDVYCDLNKGLGIASYSGKSGLLTTEDFVRFCSTAAEQTNKRVK